MRHKNQSKIKKHKLFVWYGIVLILFIIFLLAKTVKISSNQLPLVATPTATNSMPSIKSGEIFTSTELISFKEDVVKKIRRKFYFSLTIPTGWTVEKYESDNSLFSLELRKDQNSFSISHSDTYDSANCYFTPISDDNRGIYYRHYDEINTQFGLVRIAASAAPKVNSGAVGYIGCQTFDKKNGWASFTDIGSVNFYLPKYDPTIVTEMENMLKQIKVTYIN